jgi:hypothetical protein
MFYSSMNYDCVIVCVNCTTFAPSCALFVFASFQMLYRLGDDRGAWGVFHYLSCVGPLRPLP